MIKPNSVLKLVNNLLDNQFFLCRRMIFLSGEDHLLCGFLLSPTGRKGTYFLYRLIMPWYTNYNFITLDYSDRLDCLGSTDWEFELGNRDRRAVSDEIVRTIHDGGHMEVVLGARTPVGFLRYLERTGSITSKHPSHLADRGYTFVLCGMLDEAREAFRTLLAEPSRSDTWLDLRSHAAEALNSLNHGPETVLAKIAAWEEAGRKAILAGC